MKKNFSIENADLQHELGSFDVNMRKRTIENVLSKSDLKRRNPAGHGKIRALDYADDMPVGQEDLIGGVNAAWSDLDSGRMDLRPAVLGYQVGSAYPVYDRNRMTRILERLGYSMRVSEAWLAQFAEILEQGGDFGGIIAVQKDDLDVETMKVQRRKNAGGKTKLNGGK